MKTKIFDFQVKSNSSKQVELKSSNALMYFSEKEQ